MVYIGIDPSLSGTAVTVLNNNKQIVEFFTYTTNKKAKTNFERVLPKFTKYKNLYLIIHIVNELQACISKYKNNNQIAVALEGYSYGSHSRSMTSLAELCGQIKIMLLKENVDFYIIPPSLWKKVIIGKGNASKDFIKEQWIKRNYKLPWICDEYKRYDLFDSYSIVTYLYDFINDNIQEE